MFTGDMFQSLRTLLAWRAWGSVLDIGSMDRPQTLLGAARHVCVDPHQPFLDRLPSRYERRCTDWRSVLSTFNDGEFEAITLLDVIEHLPKDEGLDLLGDTIRKRPRALIVFTPTGYVEQGPGIEGGDLLSHKSGWTPEDFGDGWWFLHGVHEQGLEPLAGRTSPVPCFFALRIDQ